MKVLQSYDGPCTVEGNQGTREQNTGHGNCVLPVSYTHLDVYKRQLSKCFFPPLLAIF